MDWKFTVAPEEEGWYWFWGSMNDAEEALVAVQRVKTPYGVRSLLGGVLDELLPPGLWMKMGEPSYPSDADRAAAKALRAGAGW